MTASFGVVIPSFGAFADPDTAFALAQAAEDAGFDDIWFGDHIIVPGYAAAFTPPDWLDALTSCMVGLGATSRIRFGTDVLVAPYRNPILVAKMAASADRLSKGRLILGMGVGYLRGEFEALGAPPYAERGAVTDEYLEVMRLLWSSDGPVSYEGRYVSFSDALFGPRPVQEPMPLWVGGNAPAAFRRAARFGTGWHPLFPTPEQYAHGRREIVARRGDAGASGFTFSFSCATTKLIAEPPATYRTNTWDEIGELPDDFSYAPPVPTAPDGRPRFVGTPDQVRSDVEEYQAAGVEHFTLRFATGAPDDRPEEMLEQLRWFAADVARRPHRTQ
jgi:probable F420-dependent oxidoreductase